MSITVARAEGPAGERHDEGLGTRLLAEGAVQLGEDHADGGAIGNGSGELHAKERFEHRLKFDGAVHFRRQYIQPDE